MCGSSLVSSNPVMWEAEVECNCGSVLGNLINCIVAHLEIGCIEEGLVQIWHIGDHWIQERVCLGYVHSGVDFPGTAIGEKVCHEFS